MNVDFIPSFIQELNFDAGLHDSDRHFIRDRVFNPELKNGINSIRIELQLNPDSCKQI